MFLVKFRGVLGFFIYAKQGIYRDRHGLLKKATGIACQLSSAHLAGLGPRWLQLRKAYQADLKRGCASGFVWKRCIPMCHVFSSCRRNS